MTFNDLLAASGLWPWLLPSALLLAVSVGYFRGRDHRHFYLFAGSLWVVVSLVLFGTSSPPYTVPFVLVSLMATAVLFVPVIRTAFFALHFQWRPVTASLIALFVGILCIPLAGLVALLGGCAITGDCI